jgi:hypothetical protein
MMMMQSLFESENNSNGYSDEPKFVILDGIDHIPYGIDTIVLLMV